MKRLLSICFGFLLFVPFQVNALSGSISLNCSEKSVKPGDTVTCDVSGTSDGIVTAVEVKFSLSGASITSFTKTNSKWHDASLNRDGVTLGAYAEDTDISGSFAIGKLSIKVASDASENITINLTNPKFVDDNYLEITTGITTSGATLNIVLPVASSSASTASNPSTSTNTNNSTPSKPSTNNNASVPSKPSVSTNTESSNTEKKELFLDDILIDNYEIEFSPETLSYTLIIGDEDSLNILPVTNKADINYVVEGNENLHDGSIIYITLRSDKDSSLMTSYALNITKSNVNNNGTDTIGAMPDSGNNIGRVILIIVIIILIIINIIRLSLNIKKEKETENN